ncbi:hypothetical protein PSU4_13780 [Pseudonocardia sulfidoxydans NBRC 16205]|uniref:Uncharacterized protein n=1 Tax=Pseudonocardia sulfidoxydans NBRC 16205 TaxID=1223511 RepID=A0A511DFB7_9PSEU|nr:hypothetical protein [Pseudonocardia sulfidoxydans]GEL22424.1 hypothetical protein PSU4_13780 [Pseudonocardia sulfidoxydans NBRC 16205]
MTTVAHAPVQVMTCRGECPAAARYPDHHELLLAVDTDAEAMLGLLELAVTWHELDYTDEAVIGPAEWLDFAATHQWVFPDRAERAFSLAVDIVGRRIAGQGAAADVASSLATVIELVPN